MMRLFVSFIIFLALPAGIFLGYIAKEELDAGRKYFQLSTYALGGILFLFSVLLFDIWLNFLLATILLTAVFFKKPYLAFPIFVLASHEQKETLFIIAGVSILYLFLEGTLFYERLEKTKEKNAARVFFATYWFFLFFSLIPFVAIFF